MKYKLEERKMEAEIPFRRLMIFRPEMMRIQIKAGREEKRNRAEGLRE
jgi:hypothetical protein